VYGIKSLLGSYQAGFAGKALLKKPHPHWEKGDRE
jgi:hypothetical protein